ncbi:MAG: putative transcriptional regulator, TetR family [Actinoallomurus sp.]|jgi:AcrR family transcriptional regulator|nr:putative transcriptional regulator, TetR family [Actinoallomurus sp.]
MGEITDVVRRHLARDGAAGLSLRAVAREMGMVSSAIYRYYPSRDDLLTALIIDGYNAVGEAVERADAACPRDDHLARWFATGHAIRDWALAHPHEYALLYGSPVPGYRAPEDTIAPATRTAVVLCGVIGDACQTGTLDPPSGFPPPAESFAPDAALIREQVMPDLPDAVIARMVTAWASLLGNVSFELFGQFNNVITDRAALFDHTLRSLGRYVGLPA